MMQTQVSCSLSSLFDLLQSCDLLLHLLRFFESCCAVSIGGLYVLLQSSGLGSYSGALDLVHARHLLQVHLAEQLPCFLVEGASDGGVDLLWDVFEYGIGLSGCGLRERVDLEFDVGFALDVLVVLLG